MKFKKLKFLIIAPGNMSIPPKGWGAVEAIIWDYKFYLENDGHYVHIFNERKFNIETECKKLEKYNFDICISHWWDGKPFQLYDMFDKCKAKFLVYHCGNLYNGYIHNKAITNYKIPKNGYIICLNKFIKEYFNKFYKIKQDRLIHISNAARADLINYSVTPKTWDTISIAQISKRKRSHLITDLGIKFYGPNNGWRIKLFEKENTDNLKKEVLYKDITHNANSILLSYSEAAPLAPLESLMAGLGIIVSEACIYNLDLSMPFIHVIPEYRIEDKEYISDIIEENKSISLNNRDYIRDYAEKNHSYDVIYKQFIETMYKIVS